MAVAPDRSGRMNDVRAPLVRLARSRWAPFGAAFLAFALRTGGLTGQSLWRDEVDALRFATQPLDQLLAMFRNEAQNGPLYFLSLRPWIVAAGRTEFALRFPSALAGTLAVVLTYALVRRLAGRTTALLAGLIMAVAPYLVWYGQEAKMYAALTVLVPASLLALVEAVRLGRWWRWAALYALTSLAFYTHLIAVLIVAVQALWLLLLVNGRPLRRVLVAGGYVFLLFLPYLPLLAWQPAFLTAERQTGFAFVPLGDMLQVLVVGWALGIRPVQSAIALLPAALLLVAGSLLVFLGPAERRGEVGERRGTVLLLIWLLLPPLLLYAVTLRIAVFTDRYLIWVAPAFFALVAAGAVRLGHILPAKVALLGPVVLVPFLALQLSAVEKQATQPIKSDFRSAAAYLAPKVEPGDALVFQIPYARYTFSYYASGDRNPEDPRWYGQDGPYTNNGIAAHDVDAWLTQQLGQARRVWLVGSEIPLWDERRLLEKWLSERGVIMDEQTYELVFVRRYDITGP